MIHCARVLIFKSFVAYIFVLLCRHRRTGPKEPNELEELEIRMDSIMAQLLNIKNEVEKLKRNGQKAEENMTLVIEADPSNPPISLQILVHTLTTQQKIRTHLTVHRHSSLKTTVPEHWLKSTVDVGCRLNNQLNLTWIWKTAVDFHPTAKVVNRVTGDIRGEAAIARLLARLIESWTQSPFYENLDCNSVAQVDEWIDLFESNSQPGPLLKRIEARLAVADWLAGPHRGTKSLADIFLSAALRDRLTSSRAKDWSTRSCLI